MGVMIDFRSAARKLRVVAPDQAVTGKSEPMNDIKTRLKLELRLALALLDWKITLLNESMLALDKSRCGTAILEEQIDSLKKMLRIAVTAVDAL